MTDTHDEMGFEVLYFVILGAVALYGLIITGDLLQTIISLILIALYRRVARLDRERSPEADL